MTSRFLTKLYACAVTLFLLLTLPAPPVAAAPAFAPGDAFVSDGDLGGQVFFWLHPNGTAASLPLPNTQTFVPVTFDAAGNLYFLGQGGAPGESQIDKLGAPGGKASIYVSDLTNIRGIQNMLFNHAGELIIATLQNGVFKVPAGGGSATLISGTQSLKVQWMDVASDQTTMYWADGASKSIHRFDLSTGSALRDFVTNLRAPVQALQIMPDGGLLVSYGTQVERFDSSGNSVKAYTLKAPNFWKAFNLALDPDGATFWTTDLTNVYRFRLADGSLVKSFVSANNGDAIGGVAVYGQFEAAMVGLPTPAADAGKSTVSASPLLTPGDGKTAATVTVTLLAADGTTPVSGKTVTLAQGSGSHAVIGAASGPSDASGKVTFTVTDATPEDVTFTATDSTDNVAITQTATVTFLAHPAYVKGYPDGTFKPDDPVTRAQLAKVLAVALGLDTAGAPAAGFPDVATDFWAYGYINAVRAKGLIKGFPDGTFNPGGQVTHGQLAAIVARQLGLQPVAGAGSHWAAGYIAAIRQAGFLKDFKDQTYDPDAPATRAEVVVLVEEMTGRQKASGSVTAQFTDVPATYWAAAYIQDATHEGWAP